MKRWTALLLALSLMVLVSACDSTEEGTDTGVSQSTELSETETYVSLSDELEQAGQVKLNLGEEAEELSEFAAAMEAMRDQGLEFLSYGMTRQAAWCFGYVGGSVSALRLAAQQLAEQDPTGFSDWDTVGAISYCTPVPFLCEAIVAEQQGNTERAAACREMAEYNIVYTVEGIDALSVLTELSEEGLLELIEGSKAFEEHIYWFYPADPQAEERCGFEWSAEYHLNLAGSYEALDSEELATECYLNALAADPFSPDVYAFCAKAMYAISDVDLMWVYIEEGLLLDPNHGTLNTLAAMLWSAAGDLDKAQTYLDTAKAAELSEDEIAICEAVEAFMEGE